MYLFADSGSTKTSWRFIDENLQIHQFKTDGLNPLFTSENQLKFTVDSLPDRWSSKNVKGIEFYGSGCVDVEQKNKVEFALNSRFRSAKIKVDSDLLGAAKAASDGRKSIVCILGTGSNCCLFDGIKILDRVPPLGYILGDEGSGTALGKAFLKALLRGQLSSEITDEFKKSEYNSIDPIQRVYGIEKPNKYLASISEFILPRVSDSGISKIVISCFEELAENIALLEAGDKMSINFVGSIAFYYQNILSKVLRDRGYRIGKIVQEPVAALATNYINNINESNRGNVEL